jgi:hypothetical protein
MVSFSGAMTGEPDAAVPALKELMANVITTNRTINTGILFMVKNLKCQR